MPPKGFNTILQRTLTGIIFIAVIIGALLYNAYASFVVFGLAMYITFIEFLNITSDKNISKGYVLSLKVIAMGFYAATYFYAVGKLYISPVFWIIPSILIVGIVDLYNKDGNILKNVSTAVLGLIYIVLPFSLVNVMINMGGEFDGIILLMIFILIWANDSFAYLFGVTFGKHRLWERISPKKSWEGFVGGGLCTMIMSWVVSKFILKDLQLEMIGLAIIVIIFGTFGDLFESQIKRQFDVKDSGKLLPGHGGFWDRFDSFLFIIPVAMIYLQVKNLFF